MGEPKIEFFSRHHTFVLWNMEDYPIPAGADLRLIRRNIEDALDFMGFDGIKEFEGYCEQLRYDRKELQNAGISYFQVKDCCRPQVICTPEKGCFNSAAVQIPEWMIIFATSTASGPANFVVIAKQSRESELYRVQQCIKSRGHNVLLVQPPDHSAEEPLFRSVESVVDYAQLLGGGKPVNKYADFDDSFYNEQYWAHIMGKECSINIQDVVDYYSHFLDEPKPYCYHGTTTTMGKEDSSKILDFSERITTVDEDYTAIFWDVDDCPFPLSSNPDQIYRIIESALLQRGIEGKVSIWAYVDEKKGSWATELRNKTWEASIYFLPGGDDRAARRNRMINDIFILVMDYPANCGCPWESSLIVVADQIGDDTYFFDRLRTLYHRHYFVALVTPIQETNKPESSEWPGLLIDYGGYFFGSEREISEPCLKKRSVVVAEETPEGSGDHGNLIDYGGDTFLVPKGKSQNLGSEGSGDQG